VDRDVQLVSDLLMVLRQDFVSTPGAQGNLASPGLVDSQLTNGQALMVELLKAQAATQAPQLMHRCCETAIYGSGSSIRDCHTTGTAWDSPRGRPYSEFQARYGRSTSWCQGSTRCNPWRLAVSLQALFCSGDNLVL